jgi:hypothetical protein
MFKVQIKGVDAAIRGLKEAHQKRIQQVDDALDIFGQKTVADAKRAAPVDEGILRSLISYAKAPLKVTISVNVDYAAYIEFGTRSFAQNYVSSLPTEWQTFAAQYRGGGGGSFEEFVMRLQRWCKMKLGDEKLAYIVALSILRKGIRPHPYLIPAVEKNKIELIKRLKEL